MRTSVYQKRFIQKRKENGLCISCGKPLDRDGVHCTECRKQINENTKRDRQFYQEHGICPRCRKNKIFGNERVCPECAAKAYAVTIKNRNREHYNKSHREWSKSEYQRRKDEGICTRCGKRKATEGYFTCKFCREKNNKRRREQSTSIPRKERHKYGVCAFCNEPLKPGYKVCKKHYQMNVEKSRSQKANLARKKLIEQGILY